MDIGRRVEHCAHHQRHENDEGRHQKDHEDGWTVAAIGELEIEPTGAASRCKLEITGKQRSLAAARATTEQSGGDWRWLCHEASKQIGAQLWLRPVKSVWA